MRRDASRVRDAMHAARGAARATTLTTAILVAAAAIVLAHTPVPRAFAQSGPGGVPPSPATPADPAASSILRQVGIDQRLGESIPLDLRFRDESGRDVRIGDYFGAGKPVILSLVYYECPMLCTQVLNGLASALDIVTLDAGKDFTVLTVSFDPRETPDLAAAKKKSYLERYHRPGAEAGWHFLTGDSASIAALTAAAGFRYSWDPEINQYAHASGITVLTPRGVLARYFFGIEYSPRDLRLGLVEASENKIGTPADHLLLYCYRYDPASGKYGAVALNMVRVGGVVTLVCLGSFLFFSLRAERRKRRAAPVAGAR